MRLISHIYVVVHCASIHHSSHHHPRYTDKKKWYNNLFKVVQVISCTV